MMGLHAREIIFVIEFKYSTYDSLVSSEYVHVKEVRTIESIFRVLNLYSQKDSQQLNRFSSF